MPGFLLFPKWGRWPRLIHWFVTEQRSTVPTRMWKEEVSSTHRKSTKLSACQHEISNHFSDTKATGISCLSVGEGLWDKGQQGRISSRALICLGYFYSYFTDRQYVSVSGSNYFFLLWCSWLKIDWISPNTTQGLSLQPVSAVHLINNYFITSVSLFSFTAIHLFFSSFTLLLHKRHPLSSQVAQKCFQVKIGV